MRLRPVIFRYQKPFADGSKPIQYGLIAEEVAEVYPDLVARSADGQIETVKYQVLDSMILNEVQRQERAMLTRGKSNCFRRDWLSWKRRFGRIAVGNGERVDCNSAGALSDHAASVRRQNPHEPGWAMLVAPRLVAATARVDNGAPCEARR